MSATPEKLQAADVLNMDYLNEIARYFEEPRSWPEAVRKFAYDTVHADSHEARNTLLTDLLTCSTYLHSSKSNELVVKALARDTKSDLEPLRNFAKQVGVKLEKG